MPVLLYVLNHTSRVPIVNQSLEKNPHLAAASLAAATTLVFIEPDLVLPKFLDQIRFDLDSAKLGAITPTDLAIWTTEEGVAFVDGK